MHKSQCSCADVLHRRQHATGISWQQKEKLLCLSEQELLFLIDALTTSKTRKRPSVRKTTRPVSVFTVETSSPLITVSTQRNFTNGLELCPRITEQFANSVKQQQRIGKSPSSSYFNTTCTNSTETIKALSLTLTCFLTVCKNKLHPDNLLFFHQAPPESESVSFWVF